MTAPHLAHPLPPEVAPFSRTIRAGGLAWHLLDTGPALADLGVAPRGTVLAVHGNPTWSYLWRHVLAATLEQARSGGDAWRVVAVDQLEMGWSERTGRHRDLATRVADLGRLTDALDLHGPIVTLGHDWGGVVSLGWAVDHPDLLAGVVLTNTAVHQPPGAPVPAALRVAMHPALVGRATADAPAFLAGTLAIAHPRLAGDVRAAYRSPYASADRRRGIAGFVRDIPADAAHPSRAELDRIAEGARHLGAPALVLWGPRDPVFQERYLADLEQRLPDVRVHRFEGAGHLLPEDADVAGALLDFLRDRTAPAADAPTIDAPAVDTSAADAPFEPMGAALSARAADDGTALADLATGRTVSWRRLADRVDALARGLVALGVRPGDRVSLLVPPGADLTAAFYACLRIGAVVVVADAGLGVSGLTRAVRGARPQWIVGIAPALALAAARRWPGRRILAGAGSSALLGAVGTLAAVARAGAGTVLPEPPSPDDPAAVVFTSGSTGPAKGVRYSQRSLAAVRDALRTTYGIGTSSGLVAGFAPFALLGPALGCRTAVPDMDVTRPSTLTAAALGDAVAAVDADIVFCSPAALANVAATADGPPLGGVRLVLSAGAPVGLPLLERAATVFPNAALHTPYGMTECLLVTDATLDDIRAASGDGVLVGAPVPHVRVRVDPLGADGRPLGTPTTDPGPTGEIQVRAPHQLSGYDRLWRTDCAARTADGWHRTGDVGHLDGDGRLWVEGRLPHVITADGAAVTPVGVEQAAERVPGVRRAAAVGVGPAGTQQLVVAAETGARPGLAPAAIAAAVRAEVGRPVAAVLAVGALPTDIRHRSKIDRVRVGAWATRLLSGERAGRP